METTVLIVHDDAAFFEATKAALLAALPGCDVIGAISAPRALGMVRQHKPDVVIADGDLEGMDGYAFTAELKGDAELSSIPVLIVANDPSEASALKARQVGAAGHLPVGIDSQSLVQKVAALAGASAAAAAAPAPAPAPAPYAETAPPAAPAEPLGVGGAAPVPSAAPAPAPAPVAAPAPTPGPAAYGAPQELPTGYGAPQPAASPDVRASAAGNAPHVDDLLRLMIDLGGSDLHITVGSAPGIRVRGELASVENYKVLTPKDTQEMLLSLLSEEQRRRFETELELDFAYSIPGLSRFRTNIFQQRNSMGAVFRVIPLKIPTLDDLQLPRVCKFLADRPRGMVLVTGPTGSGKSTTLAAMIDHINETRPVHIMTMEDPIEFMHKNKKAFVNQREVGEDTHSFTSALKRVLRQDPDVILVGEMRDLETISAALTAAETGHLVLATLHTTGGPETVDRIIDVFPPHQQQQVRMQLSTTLEGVLSQTLLRSTDGRSRVMAMEIMLGIPAIGNLIREGKTHQMATIIQGGASMGMQTLDQHLKVLLQSGKVTYEEAIQKAKEPRELAQMVGRKI
ncbi:MAG: PilT/PilU family type 4a pilus ATPase [Coriobacteriia bacterium]|nr:PilT/PilU family type 4a pilus ATPase [Coriobacteriia bacterium]